MQEKRQCPTKQWVNGASSSEPTLKIKKPEPEEHTRHPKTSHQNGNKKEKAEEAGYTTKYYKKPPKTN